MLKLLYNPKWAIFISIAIAGLACSGKTADPKSATGSNAIEKSDSTLSSVNRDDASKENKSSAELCYNPNLVKDTTKKSIKSIAIGLIGGDTIKINYHSPGVRKRIIWGGLVPYDEVWVTGAHDATSVEFPIPVIIGGKEIPAGKYAIFTIPGRNDWTVIINSHWKQHLASEYDQKDDIVRLKLKPVQHAHTERLQYFIEDANHGKGTIAIAWEKLKISFDLLSMHDQ